MFYSYSCLLNWNELKFLLILFIFPYSFSLDSILHLVIIYDWFFFFFWNGMTGASRISLGVYVTWSQINCMSFVKLLVLIPLGNLYNRGMNPLYFLAFPTPSYMFPLFYLLPVPLDICWWIFLFLLFLIGNQCSCLRLFMNYHAWCFCCLLTFTLNDALFGDGLINDHWMIL